MSFLPFAAPDAIRNALPFVGSWRGGRRFEIEDLEGFRRRFLERLLQTALYSPELDGAVLAVDLLLQAAEVAGVEIVEEDGGPAVASAHALLDPMRVAWSAGERRFARADGDWRGERDPAALGALTAAIAEESGRLVLVTAASPQRQLDDALIGLTGLPEVFWSQLETGCATTENAGDHHGDSPVARAYWRLDHETRQSIRTALAAQD